MVITTLISPIWNLEKYLSGQGVQRLLTNVGNFSLCYCTGQYITDNLCSFCQQEPETYMHLFLHCDKVKQIWKFAIENYHLEELKDMNWKDIFLGISGNSDRLRSINSLIILLKYTIFKSRSENNLPTREKIVKIIAEHIEDEKTLASKAGKMPLHLRKWESLNPDH